MTQTKIIFDIRKKENKSMTEEMLLNYYKSMCIINEILVSLSKQEISEENAISKIRKINIKELNKTY